MDTISIAFTSGADKAKYDQPEVRPATAGQSENALRDLIVLPWNDLQALERVLAEEGDAIAAHYGTDHV